MYEHFPVARLPEPLARYIRRYFPLGPTVWMTVVPEAPFAIGVVSSSDKTYHGVVFNLAKNAPDFEVVRPRLSIYAVGLDFRVRLAMEEKEMWPVGPDQCFLRLGLSTSTSPSSAHITVARETSLLYFNLANIGTALSHEEAAVLVALTRLNSKGRKDAFTEFQTYGIDVKAIVAGLAQKGFAKVLKKGISVTPEGRYRASQPGMEKYVYADYKMRTGQWPP